jgi:GcrA cell cycle regulator
MSWTDERVELLRKLWLEGLSASQIARELANGISRNAVIGKVHRLGMSGRIKAAAPVAARPRTKVTRHTGYQRAGTAMVRGNTALAIRSRPVEAILPAPEEDVVIPMSEMVTIMDLKESMCRWPMGDPVSSEFRYCGAKKGATQTGSYCSFHSRVAYQPLPDRRRDRRAQSA